MTIHKDGTYTVAEGTQSYSAATSDMTTPLPLTGGAMFTRIPNGRYYLIETEAPEGYEKSSEIIPVVVDNTGIYADAGGAGDDVSVQRGVGSIVHSMIQFATDDDNRCNTAQYKSRLVYRSFRFRHSIGRKWMGKSE